jgi:UDP-glucose 4-epimerase
MKYIITGGSGFIGTNLIKRILQNQNNTVRIIDLKPPKDSDVYWIFGDISQSQIDENFEGIDVVVHLACQPGVEASVKDPIGTFHQNVYGTLRCLEASRKAGVKRFIFASSGGTVLGKQNEPLNEKLAPNPASPYGASKLACEGYCKAYYHTYGLETVILRFSNVYGPHSEHKGFNLIPGFIMNILQNKTCYINGDGNIKKDYIYVEDLIKTIMVSATLPSVAGEIFQIATGKGRTINEITEILNKLSHILLGKRMKIKHRNERVGDVSYECDINKAEIGLLFEPAYELRFGLELTLNWFRDNWGKVK